MRWILVSDASRASVFRTSSPKNDNWQLHQSFEHGESRDLTTFKQSELQAALSHQVAPLFGTPVTT